MGGICKFLGTIYGIVGTIGAFLAAHFGGRTAGIGYGGVRYERNFLLTVAIFLGVELSVAMVSIALHTLGEISENVNSALFYVQGTKKDNKLAEVAKEEQENRTMIQGGWKCPSCGRVNNSYETTCRCGRSKYDRT